MVSAFLPSEPFQGLSSLAKVLAHPTRLQILHVLADDEACVCHLTAVLGLRQANVSQHLMVLRDARLVADRRDGMMVYYRLSGRRVPHVIQSLLSLLTEESLSAQMPSAPRPPVAGCPCPKCAPESNRRD
jgi:ArsR family transcriptional regulator